GPAARASRRRRARSRADGDLCAAGTEPGLALQPSRASRRRAAPQRAHGRRRPRNRAESGRTLIRRGALACAAFMLAHAPSTLWAAQVVGADVQLARDQVRIVIDT